MDTQENNKENLPPSNENEKETSKVHEEKNKIINNQDIIKNLMEANIDYYEPQVVTNLTNYINNYTLDILNSASTFMKHAERSTINVSDVKLAIETFNQKAPARRLPLKELIKLAQEQNKEKLEECSATGLPLPKNDCTLCHKNYKLKSLHSHNILNQQSMEFAHRHNHMLSLNQMKNQVNSIPTLIRTSVGTVSLNVPMNLAPQRIILKQPAFAAFNRMDEHEHARKRMKFDGMRK